MNQEERCCPPLGLVTRFTPVFLSLLILTRKEAWDLGLTTGTGPVILRKCVDQRSDGWEASLYGVLGTSYLLLYTKESIGRLSPCSKPHPLFHCRE